MLFIAKSLAEKDKFLCKARELTAEENLSVRPSEELNHRWIVTVRGLPEETEWLLQQWVNRVILQKENNGTDQCF